MEIPQKIKNRTAIRSSNSTPGYFSDEKTNTNSKRYIHPVCIAALFTLAKIWKQHKCPSIDRWIKKISHTYKHTHTLEYYTAIKKNGILPFVTTWMGLEGIMLSEISHRERKILYDFTYM